MVHCHCGAALRKGVDSAEELAVGVVHETTCGRGETMNDLVMQWNDRANVLESENLARGIVSAPGAFDLPTILLTLLPKFLPIMLAILSGGFAPAMLLVLLPDIIKQVFPNLDAGLVSLLIQIIESLVKK
jgi:hypothetical protein